LNNLNCEGFMGVSDAAEPKFYVENIITKMADSIWRLYFLTKGYFFVFRLESVRLESLLLVIKGSKRFSISLNLNFKLNIS